MGEEGGREGGREKETARLVHMSYLPWLIPYVSDVHHVPSRSWHHAPALGDLTLEGLERRHVKHPSRVPAYMVDTAEYYPPSAEAIDSEAVRLWSRPSKDEDAGQDQRKTLLGDAAGDEALGVGTVFEIRLTARRKVRRKKSNAARKLD